MQIQFSGNNHPSRCSILFKPPSKQICNRLVRRLKYGQPRSLWIAGAGDRSQAATIALGVADEYRRQAGGNDKDGKDCTPYVALVPSVLKIRGTEKEPGLVKDRTKGLFWLTPQDLLLSDKEAQVGNMVRRHIPPATEAALKAKGITGKLRHPYLFNQQENAKVLKLRGLTEGTKEFNDAMKLSLFCGYTDEGQFYKPHLLSDALNTAAGEHKQGCLLAEAENRAKQPKPTEPEDVLFSDVAPYLKPDELRDFVGNIGASSAKGSLFVLGPSDPGQLMATNTPNEKRLDNLLKQNGFKPIDDPVMSPKNLRPLFEMNGHGRVLNENVIWEKQ